jgi:methylthioxylose transferase
VSPQPGIEASRAPRDAAQDQDAPTANATPRQAAEWRRAVGWNWVAGRRRVAGRRAGAEVAFASAALVLVGTAIAVGVVRNGRDEPLFAGAAPLFGYWHPHAGPGTAVAIAVAVAVVTLGPGLAARLAWPRLLAAGYVTAVVWTGALAMVDGWQRGLAGRLTGHDEYLHEVPGVTSVWAMLRGFEGRILDFQPGAWATHVAGHPPGALLAFVGLDRIGLGGGGPAAVVCVLVGASVAVSVPVALRALGAVGPARAAVPFLALFPGAVWVGVSADGLFAGVVSWGVALLALGRRSNVAALAGGVLLGYGLYLSYGLVLMALPALAVLLLSPRLLPVLLAAAGAGLVVAAFTVAGFWWLDGYHLVVERYYQGIGAERPYGYWVWANLASLVLAVGPAAAAGLAAVSRPGGAVSPPGGAPRAVRALLFAVCIAVLLADVSGLSKAETERIWLPFAVWLVAAAAVLPHPRPWLAVNAAVALAVNHLVFTGW